LGWGFNSLVWVGKFGIAFLGLVVVNELLKETFIKKIGFWEVLVEKRAVNQGLLPVEIY